MSDNLKETEKRTISTSRLERIREANNMSVAEFIESLLSYEVETPSDSFQSSITKFGEKMSATTKTQKITISKEPDWDKLTIQHLIDYNIYPISGVLNRVQSSRKYEGEHIYSVSIEQGPGTKAQTICDLTDLSSVRVEFNNILLKVIDVLSDESIPNRVYKQGYQIVNNTSEKIEAIGEHDTYNHNVTDELIASSENTKHFDTVHTEEIEEEEIY